MKKLSTYLFLVLLSISTFSFADDIRDFQIEGMSIGDSALDFFSKEDIIKNSKSYYKNKKFTPVENNNYPFFKTYFAVDFNFKTGDSKYKIHSLRGVIDYRNKSLSECKKQLREIFNEIAINFQKWEKESITTVNHIADPSGKSKYISGSFWSDQGVISVSCTDYSEETGWMDHLGVAIKTKDFNKWLKIAYEE